MWGFSRAVAADAEALVELGVPASVIESPISDAKLAALGVTRESMLERIRNAVSFAAEHGITVAYFGVDGTRADLEFFRQAYETAIEAGAKEAVVVDTIGIATPEAVADLVGRTREWLGPDVPVHFHGHNDFGLATAAAAAAVRAGATWVQGTINGMGERGGNANLIEVALTLDALYGVSTNLRLDRAREVSHLVAEVSGTPLEAWKPVVGENLFTRESGAVASQFHDPPAIEPYSSELVARRALGRARQEERDRLDPARGRAPRPRRPGGAVARPARQGEGARRREARPRHRRRIQSAPMNEAVAVIAQRPCSNADGRIPRWRESVRIRGSRSPSSRSPALRMRC